MMAKPGMVRITGRARPEMGDSWCGQPDWEDFEIESPRFRTIRQDGQNSGEDGDDSVDVEFLACLSDCEDESACNAAKDEGLELCPNHDAPEFW